MTKEILEEKTVKKDFKNLLILKNNIIATVVMVEAVTVIKTERLLKKNT